MVRRWTAVGVASAAALYVSTSRSGPLETPVSAIGAAAFFGRSLATNTHAVYAMYGVTLIVAVILVVANEHGRRCEVLTERSAEPVQCASRAFSRQAP